MIIGSFRCAEIKWNGAVQCGTLGRNNIEYYKEIGYRPKEVFCTMGGSTRSSIHHETDYPPYSGLGLDIASYKP